MTAGRRWFDRAFDKAARKAERDIRKKVRRLVFRQKYRAVIRRDQEEFLKEHPELRLPTGRSHHPIWDKRKGPK